MAFQESDREDLMEEATALVRRAEIVVDEFAEPLIFGFRKTGALSCYFAPGTVYHFDGQLRLKRAFVAGILYRTQGETLARLKRNRAINIATGRKKTELLRNDLDEKELGTFKENLQQLLRLLVLALEQHHFRVIRQIPSEKNLAEEFGQSLEQILVNGVQLAPRFRGKR